MIGLVQAVPFTDLVVNPTKVEEVEEMLRRLRPPGNAKPAKYKTGRFTFTVASGVATALGALATVFLIKNVLDTIEDYETPRQRRRRRTQLCSGELLILLDNASEDIEAGYFSNRALETKEDETRHKRKFKSRP